MNPYQAPGRPPEGPERRRGWAAGSFVAGFLLFWFGGAASCAGLSPIPLRIIYPFIVAIGLGLHIAALVFIGRQTPGQRSGCLLATVILALLAAIAWTLLSLSVIYSNGMH